MEDYFASYLKYAGAGESEPPIIFHRWSAISIVGALLSRKIWIPFGHSQIYPNQYIMFMGNPGARKSTAINIGVKLLKKLGYAKFAADKVSKEMFLKSMSNFTEPDFDDLDAVLDLSFDEPAESFIVAEEFTDFTGQNNMEFLTMLTKLWDNPPDYKHPKIHGKDVEVIKPTINILSGNTSQGFALAFPAEALGNGFLSRILLVYGETTGRKITFPKAADPKLAEEITEHLRKISHLKGECSIGTEARELCDRLYKEYVEPDDHRFKSYATRRFTHLLKLAMVIAATRLSLEISSKDLIRANTMLFVTESKMPRALGEFGKSKNSDVASGILDYLHSVRRPVGINDLWKKVHKDLNKQAELVDILKGLESAEKITRAQAGKVMGFVPVPKQAQEWAEDLLELDWMTIEELE